MKPFFDPIKSTFRHPKADRLSDADLLAAWSRFSIDQVRRFARRIDKDERVNEARARVLALREAREQARAA